MRFFNFFIKYTFWIARYGQNSGLLDEAYKKRYEAKMSDSAATNNSVRNIITKIRRDIYNSIWNFHIGNELEEYSRNLDGYYLALLRNLLEIADMRKRDADMYYDAIVDMIESCK